MFRAPSNVQTMRPYVERALRDDDLRRNVVRAFSAARKVYGDLSDKDPLAAASSFARDRDVRDHLDTALENLVEANDRLRGTHRRKQTFNWLLVVGGVLLVLFNPVTGRDTRQWLKDHLVGSDDEFDYGA